jgi:hypothetical protein
MQRSSIPARQSWFLSTVSLVAADKYWPTPDGLLDGGLVALLERLRGVAKPDQELTVLVDEEVADIYRLRLAVDDPDDHPVRRDVGAAGWKSSRIGYWSSFWGEDRPTVYLGQLDELENRARNDKARQPFGSFVEDTVAQCQQWAELTGVPWQAEPAVMGVEMMRRLFPSYRVDGSKGYRRPTKIDERTPELAGEGMWTPDTWRGPDDSWSGTFLHWYDKVKAGLVAAGQAKVSPEPLRHWVRPRYDPKRAGWWLISKPVWNERRLPHPAGPYGEVWERIWVTTPTMDLLAELAERGQLDMPEPIESYTGVARPVLKPWCDALWAALRAPITDRYSEVDVTRVRAAAAEVARRGLGMLAHRGSSVYRLDWFHAVNAMKRANTWRMADRIATGEDRWPVMLDDDSLCYASELADPVAAAPAGFSAPTAGGKPRTLGGSDPADWRAEADKTRAVRQ